LLARLAAGVFYAWNPYLAERLVIGHWALLLGYAGLPWVVAAAWGGRPARPPRPDQPGRPPRPDQSPRPARSAHPAQSAHPDQSATSWAWLRSASRLGGAVIPAAVGGFAAVAITALAALPAALADRTAPPDQGRRTARVRRLVITAAVLGLASLPWLIPSLLVAVHTDPAGADAFAARPDTPFGGAGSLLMLGGIWNAQVVPRGYGGAGSAAWLLVVLMALVAYVLLGWRGRACPGLGIAAVAGFAVAAVGLTGPSRAALRHLIAAWPGFGVLRDGQQFIAPLALAEAIGLGLAVAWLITGLAATSRGPGRSKASPVGAPPPDAGPAGGGGARGAAVTLAVMAVIAPVILLPGLAWGAAGRLHATAYPADWLAARRLIDAGPSSGSVALLPWAAYRRFAWNDGGAVLDPWTKLLARPVIWNDALQVGTQTVAAEDAQARRLTPVIAGARSLTGPLRAAGVRYVIVDAGPLLRGDDGSSGAPGTGTGVAGTGTGAPGTGAAGTGAPGTGSVGPGRDGAGDAGSCLAERARLPGATVVLASADLIVFRLPAKPADPGANPAKGPTCPAMGR
ncbi:MAG TPA: hypothetical protein VK586_05680, partial [Streptosporangiaceae bacterium]|nr:hypothetical protein [Streptosporangiaceae bacterium]